MSDGVKRYPALDGWRGLSILLVLAAHLLPLGPKSFRLNEASGILGMSIFFCLSGFLIANFFVHSDDVKDFFLKRFARILPLAWLGLLLAFVFYGLTIDQFLWSLFFVANWPPMYLIDVTGHYWSLCVEMQYYVFVGLAFYIFGRNYAFVILLACLLVTLYRVVNGVEVAINTYYRVDEILAGSLLLFSVTGKHAFQAKRFLAWLNPMVPLVLLVLASHHAGEWLHYLRPYFAALLVGSTLYAERGFWPKFLNLRILSYLAVTSYALYVIHPFLGHTWLGEGEGVEKYLKRPLLFAVLFVLAHLSTTYYERIFINWSRKRKAPRLVAES